jgi:CheY-like chemotaxis protein
MVRLLNKPFGPLSRANQTSGLGIDSMQIDLMQVIKIIIWPILILVLCIIFRGPISELIKPNPDQSMVVKVGPSGIEISRVASAAAAVAAGAAARAEQGQPVNQQVLANNLAQGIEASLRSGDVKTLKRKILWVDDMPSNNDYLIRAFQDLGIVVTTSTSTSEAQKELSDNKFNLVISDMSRPDDDRAGLALIKIMRELNVQTPIIIYAAKWASEHKGQEKEIGAILITNDPSEIYSTVLKQLLTST